MRKSILIAAMVLMSATAQAAPSRSLTLALNDGPAAAVQPKAVETPQATEAPKATETKPTEAPQFVERPPGGQYHDDRRPAEARRCGQAGRGSKPEGRKAEAQALLERGAHHWRTASPRRLLVRLENNARPRIWSGSAFLC